MLPIMEKQTIIWGNIFEDWEVKTCLKASHAISFSFTAETGPGIVLSWKSRSLFSVPLHWWELWWKVKCWAEINPVQDLAWHLFLSWDPQDPTRIRLHCPLSSQTSRDFQLTLPILEVLPSAQPRISFPCKAIGREVILVQFFSGE